MHLYTYVASLYSCIYVGILFANRYKHVYAYQDGGGAFRLPHLQRQNLRSGIETLTSSLRGTKGISFR